MDFGSGKNKTLMKRPPPMIIEVVIGKESIIEFQKRCDTPATQKNLIIVK